MKRTSLFLPTGAGLRNEFGAVFSQNVMAARPLPEGWPAWDGKLGDVVRVGGNLREGQAYAIVHIVQSPMVTWIWIGGVVVALGTLYCLVPGRNERRAAAMAREGTTVSA